MDDIMLMAGNFPVGDSVLIYGRTRHMAGQPIRYITATFKVGEKVDPGAEPDPICRLGKGEAQYLMDSLWMCGLRPSEGTGSAGALAATQEHLNDLRKQVSELWSAVKILLLSSDKKE